MFTYLYMASNKAKAACTEEAKKLSERAKKQIQFEVNWKFVDQGPFKTRPQDEQKKIVTETLVPNIQAMVSGASDSFAATFESTPSFAASVDKIVLHFVHDPLVQDPVGVNWCKCAMNGKTLEFSINVDCIDRRFDGSWGLTQKLGGLFGGSAAAATLPIVAPVQQPSPKSPTPAAAVSPTPAPVKVAPAPVAAAVSPVVQAPSGAPRLIPAEKTNKIVSSSGKSTFLYMTLSKAQTALQPLSGTVGQAFGKSISVEVDWKFIDHVDFYGYTSQDNQKVILTDKVVPALKACVADATDSLVSLASNAEAKAIITAKVQKVVFKYTSPFTQANIGGAPFLNVSLVGSVLEVSIDLNFVEEPKSPSWGLAPAIMSALKGTATAASVQPVSVAPVSTAPVSSPTPATASPKVVANPVAPRPSPTPAAQPTGSPATSPLPSSATPAPGKRARRQKVGGAAGGKGKFTFLYFAYETTKKKIAEIVPSFQQLCAASAGRTLQFDIDLDGLINDESFCRESQADQKTMLTTSVVENVKAVLSSPLAFPALFAAAATEGGEFAERLAPVQRVRWVYEPKDHIRSAHGASWVELNICENNPADLEIRVNVGAVDDVIEPSAGDFPAVEKMYEAIDNCGRREEIEAERTRLAMEEKMRRDEEARAQAEEMQRRNDADRRRKAEEEEAKARAEAERGREERAAVVAPLLEHLSNYSKRIATALGLPTPFTLEIDDFFVHDKRLRFKEINYKETLLRHMTGEKASVFLFLTQAIEKVAQIPLAKEAFVAKVQKVLLRCIPTCPSPYPDVNLHDDSKVLYMDCTFSHLFDANKWITPTLGFRDSDIVEIFKAEILHDLGVEAAAAQWEAVQSCQRSIQNDFLRAISSNPAGKSIAVSVVWESFASVAKQAVTEGWLPIRLLLAHYVIAEPIMAKLIDAANALNPVVKRILMRDLKTIEFRLGNNSSLEMDPAKGQLTITIVFHKLGVDIPSMRPWFINQIHATVISKCTGITVKTVAAEMAMEDALPSIGKASETLTECGFPQVTVSWAEFVDSPQFGERYACLSSKNPYNVITGAFAGTLQTLANGFRSVTKTELGKKFAPRVKVLRVTVDPKTQSFPRKRPVLAWNETTGEFCATFGVYELVIPEEYNWRAQLEKLFGILLDTIRMELAPKKAALISSLQKDFGANIPIIFDEEFTKTTDFNALDPEDMNNIMRPAITTLPQSLLSSVEGLAKVTQLPPGKKAAHERIKSIRCFLDATMKASQYNSYRLALNNNELLISCGFQFAYDGAVSVEPIGYKIIHEILQIRPVLENYLIEECVPKIQQLQADLAKATSPVPVTFDWKNLVEQPSFAMEHDFVTSMRHIPSLLNSLMNHNSTKSHRWDRGITAMCKAPEFVSSFKSAVKSVIFRCSYSNQVSSRHGRFPSDEIAVELKDGVLIVNFNFVKSITGCGTHVEHMIAPNRAKEKENHWITKVAEKLYEQEEIRRVNEIRRTEQANLDEQRRYERDTKDFQKEQIEYQKKLVSKCSSCRGYGYWGPRKDVKCSHCKTTGMEYGSHRMPREPRPPQTPRRYPTPTFVNINTIDFKGRSRRETLLEFY